MAGNWERGTNGCAFVCMMYVCVSTYVLVHTCLHVIPVFHHVAEKYARIHTSVPLPRFT